MREVAACVKRLDAAQNACRRAAVLRNHPNKASPAERESDAANVEKADAALIKANAALQHAKDNEEKARQLCQRLTKERNEGKKPAAAAARNSGGEEGTTPKRKRPNVEKDEEYDAPNKSKKSKKSKKPTVEEDEEYEDDGEYVPTKKTKRTAKLLKVEEDTHKSGSSPIKPGDTVVLLDDDDDEESSVASSKAEEEEEKDFT